MMKWKILVAILFISACSGQPLKHYYQLPSLAVDTPSAKPFSTENQLYVGLVTVADYLNGAGVVYQTSDVQYVMAENHLWAGALEQQLQQTLVENLDHLLPTWLVSSQPLGDPKAVALSVRVTAFHGRYDGRVVVRGEWVLNRRDHYIKQPFALLMLQPEEGYESLIRTLSSAWQQEARAIATKLNLFVDRDRSLAGSG